MEFVSATVPQELTLILRTEFVNLAHQTVSAVLQTLSAMLAMLVLISAKESVLRQLSHAQLENSDIMESATELAQLVLANKVTSVKELALLELGHIMEDVIELAQLNSLQLMLVLTLAQLEHLFQMEFVNLELKLV